MVFSRLASLDIEDGRTSLQVLAIDWRIEHWPAPASIDKIEPSRLKPDSGVPPERVFSILNDTFDDDQDSAKADYIELSLQLQFNERSRSGE